MSFLYKFKTIFNYYFNIKNNLFYKNKYLILLEENKFLKKKNKKLKKKIKKLLNNNKIETSIFSEEFNIDESYYPLQAF